MAVFLSSAYIHSELHSFRAPSALHTDPLNLQCVTLYQNPDGHYKKEKLQFDISWDQSYSKKKKKKFGKWKPVMFEKIIYRSTEKFLSCMQCSM